MWMLNFIPDWMFHLAALGSIFVLIISFISSRLIPVIYRLPVQFVALALAVGAVWLEGNFYNQRSWQQRIDEQQAEIARLEAASQQITIETVTKYIERTKIVKEKSGVIIKEIPKYITAEVDARCDIPVAAVVLHDAAAKSEFPDTTNGINAGTSDVTLSRLLDTTVANYGTFHEVREQLMALQDWVREQKKLNP